MSVRKPLEKSQNHQPMLDIETLISRGASVTEDNRMEAERKAWTHLNLRISIEMLNNIDEAMKERVGISRTGWILEAIQEKIKRNIQIS